MTGFAILAGCGQVSTCPTSAPPQDVRNLALRQLIKEANASSDATMIHFNSIADFIAKNPDCCALRGMAKGASQVDLSKVQLTILYRRQAAGPEPYFERTVEFGPCIENMEDSGRTLTPKLHRLFITHRHEEVVK